MNEIIIRKADVKDVDIICRLGVQTFEESFWQENTAEDMALFLAENFNENQVTGELENQESIFIVAQAQGIPVGYMKLNTGIAQTEVGHPNTLEVQRLYVLRAFKGRGIGKKLMEYALDIAKKMTMAYIWLGVWEHNKKAIGFYERFGFRQFDTHTFMVGEDAQMDWLMKLKL